MFGVSIAKIDNNFEFQSRQQQNNETDKRKNYDGSLQNGQITQFYFKKLKEQEISLSLIIVINIYLIIVATNQSFPKITIDTLATLNICLYFAMLCVTVAIILLTMRSLTLLSLQKQQKQIYQKASIFSKWIILLVQPYPFFNNINIQTYNAFQDYPIQYPLNDLLAILSFARIYILLRTALILTPYMNNRSNRLCKMYGCRADFSYSLKCMFKEHPLKLICIFYSVIAGIFAYLVYLAQRQLFVQNNGTAQVNACTRYVNSLWLILITTTTVGYGDYYPQTPLGRIIILFVAIWGTLIVSIMVVVVSNTLNMEKTQVRTAKILNKLELRQQHQKRAGKVVGYMLLKNYGKHFSLERKQDIRRKIQKAKDQFRQVRKQMKQMAQFDDIEDEIATHFLKLNSDIDTLSKNQDLIIEYIHQHFNAKPNIVIPETDVGSPLIPTSKQVQLNEQQEQIEKQFMQIFRNNVKLKKL